MIEICVKHDVDSHLPRLHTDCDARVGAFAGATGVRVRSGFARTPWWVCVDAPRPLQHAITRSHRTCGCGETDPSPRRRKYSETPPLRRCHRPDELPQHHPALRNPPTATSTPHHTTERPRPHADPGLDKLRLEIAR